MSKILLGQVVISALVVLCRGQCHSPIFQDNTRQFSSLKEEIQRVQDEVQQVSPQLQQFVENITQILLSDHQQLKEEVQQSCVCPTTAPSSELLQQIELIVQQTCNDSKLIEETSQIRDDLTMIFNAMFPLGGVPSNPASSCSEITTRSVDGTYWLSSGTQAEPVQVTCDFDVQLPPLSPVSGWQEIANLNLNDSSQSCSPPWRETFVGSSRRCERTTDTGGCESVFFPTSGVPFTKLCGRVVGYGIGTPDAFHSASHLCHHCHGFDGPYVDGVSITYGPSDNRQHIWSLATDLPTESRCPCGDNAFRPPDFVGENYYCETFVDSNSMLWEGEGCGDAVADEAPCCANPNLPWFCREFDEPVTTDNIEVRICTEEERSNEDVEIDLLKIFIQ